MTLEEQSAYLLVACRRIFPRWLQSRTSPEDVAQECLLHCWRWAQQGSVITEAALNNIARQRTIDAVRRFRSPIRWGEVRQPDDFDCPWPDHDDEPDWKSIALSVIGPERFQRLIERRGYSTDGYKSAVHRARKRILNYLRRAS